MSKCGYLPGDKIIIRWPQLNGVPAEINTVFDRKCDVDVVIDPEVLSKMRVPRAQTYIISPNDNRIHLTLQRGEFEVVGKKIQVN